jgi:Ala-tRNA(Pro) deacylase
VRESIRLIYNGRWRLNKEIVMATRRIREFLDGSKVKYVVISHSPAYTAQEVAASTHIPGRRVAKTVIVNLDGKLAMAVVPASHGVEMDLLRSISGARHACLADKAEFADRFEGCQVGSMPPFGNLFGMETFVDKDLACEEFICFNAGTHTDLIALEFHDYRKLVNPRLAHLSCVPAHHGSIHTVQI